MRAFWNYFVTINAVNLPASIVIGVIAGLQWLPVAFCSFGLGIGLLAYNVFYKNQYYFYYNLGYTRTKLAVMVFTINTIIALPMLLIIFFV